MIQRKPLNRLGKNGPQEVKTHPWLKDFPWQDLWQKKVESPFMPPKQDNFDQKNINEDWKDQEEEEFLANIVSLRRNSIQAQFNGYYYDYQLAAMNVNPGLISQSEIASFIQSQQQQQTKLAATVSQPLAVSAPMIQYPKSEIVSPKNSRLPVTF